MPRFFYIAKQTHAGIKQRLHILLTYVILSLGKWVSLDHLIDRRTKMTENQNYNCKHLTTTQRIKIEKGILPLRCARYNQCQMRFLCDKPDCIRPCKNCYDNKLRIPQCSLICPDYLEPICPTLQKAPFVCNGCSKKRTCDKKKAFYSAQKADESSQKLLHECRSGINQEPVDVALLDDLISPLLKQGQSLAHIYAFHGHEIPCSRRTLYNYIDQGVFTARNIDLPRKVRYKCKPRKIGTRISLSAKEFRIGRTYEDFQKYMKKHPDTAVVEMDTVEGGRGNGKKVFLTLLFETVP